MKKLLILTRSLSVTEGQGRYSIELIKELANDFRITVFTSERPGPNEKDLDNLDLEIRDLPKVEKITKPFVYLWSSIKLWPYLLKTDLIHSFSDHPYCSLLSFLPIFKPFFITVHGTYGVVPLESRLSSFILKRAYRKADKIICISHFTQQQILNRINLKNTMVINNGIDFNVFSLKKIPKDWFKSGQEKIVLSVGNLKDRKGYHISIPAIAQAKKKIPNLKYYIVGSRPDNGYYQELKKIIKDNNLEKDVIFFQNLTDQELLKLYYQSDLFLLPSVNSNNNKFEGFGLVYLEANACGKPVIGTYGCGAEDAIKNNYNGILVEQNNINQTSKAIIDILSNQTLAEKMGKNGKEWAKKHNWTSVASEYVNVYKNFL